MFRSSWLVGLVTVLLVLSGCGSKDTAVATKTTTAGPIAVATTSASPTQVAAVTTPAGLSSEQKAALIAKVDQAISLLTPLEKPGTLAGMLDKNQYIGVVDQSNINVQQDGLDGRMTLEPLLGHDPSLDLYRGSTPPSDTGLLKEVEVAIQADRFAQTTGNNTATLGAGQLLLRACQILVAFTVGSGHIDPSTGKSTDGFYAREMPTPQTRQKFDPLIGADRGVIDIAPWKQAYFLLAEVYNTPGVAIPPPGK